jgi:membrane dipeptidase
MKRVFFIFLVSLLSACSEVQPDYSSIEVAKDSLIIDTHIDAPHKLNILNKQGQQIHDLGSETNTEFDYPKAIRGGLDVAFMSVYLSSETQLEGTSFQEANQLIDLIEDVITLNAEKFLLIKRVNDIGFLARTKKIGLALGMENGAPIEGDLDRIQYFFDRGIRYITLTHSKSNHLSDSSYDPNHQWDGLSDFGKKVVKEMNKVGIMVDVSHVSDAAFYQAIAISDVPVIASHSSLRYFTPGFERNVSDDMLLKLAEKGGVIQINFGSTFILKEARAYADRGQDFIKKQLELKDKSQLTDQELKEITDKFIEQNGKLPFANISNVVDHIDRVVKLVGINHVGIGSDFDGVGDTLPLGLKNVSMYPNLIEALIERGYSIIDIDKILGKNLLRVWRATEEYANNVR